jgi:hypothetical protein
MAVLYLFAITMNEHYVTILSFLEWIEKSIKAKINNITNRYERYLVRKHFTSTITGTNNSASSAWRQSVLRIFELCYNTTLRLWLGPRICICVSIHYIARASPMSSTAHTTVLYSLTLAFVYVLRRTYLHWPFCHQTTLLQLRLYQSIFAQSVQRLYCIGYGLDDR